MAYFSGNKPVKLNDGTLIIPIYGGFREIYETSDTHLFSVKEEDNPFRYISLFLEEDWIKKSEGLTLDDAVARKWITATDILELTPSKAKPSYKEVKLTDECLDHIGVGKNSKVQLLGNSSSLEIWDKKIYDACRKKPPLNSPEGDVHPLNQWRLPK